jgi:hypothetical protein
MPYHAQLHVMTFGLSGNHGDGVSNSGNTFTSSWYLGSPDEFIKAIPGHYDPSEVDGCLVVDKREVLDKNPGLAFRSPMCNAKLSENQVDRFSDIGAGDFLVLRAFAKAAAMFELDTGVACARVQSFRPQRVGRDAQPGVWSAVIVPGADPSDRDPILAA